MPQPATTYALITGASSGIGLAFAEALAGQGRNLILTARSGERMEELAQSLRRSGVEVRCVPADLAADCGGAAARAIEAYVDANDLVVDLLINNAGVGSGGDFAALGLEREAEILALNVAALMRLSHAFLRRMRARGAGTIVNVASTAGFQPVPYMATYAASKAFVLHFSLALWQENRTSGVHVMALCPGPTHTRFFEVAGTRPRGGRFQSPEQVVNAALRGLRARRPLVICGWRNRVLIGTERFLPRRLLLRAVASMMKP